MSPDDVSEFDRLADELAATSPNGRAVAGVVEDQSGKGEDGVRRLREKVDEARRSQQLHAALAGLSPADRVATEAEIARSEKLRADRERCRAEARSRIGVPAPPVNGKARAEAEAVKAVEAVEADIRAEPRNAPSARRSTGKRETGVFSLINAMTSIGLSAAEGWLYTNYVAYRNSRDGVAFPMPRTTCQDTGLSESAELRARKALTEYGLLIPRGWHGKAPKYLVVLIGRKDVETFAARVKAVRARAARSTQIPSR